jgi:molecular chaperone DnaK (HSP70)
MSTSFGVHVGNTSACIAVSKEGKTDVVANDAGDRVTPAMVGFVDEEIIVGLAAKQGRIRNLANTITCNKRLIAGETIADSPVTIIEQEEKVVYQVDFKEKDFFISPSEVLTHIYKYMHDIAASHCANVDESNTVISVPLGFNDEQRECVKKSATAAGFRVVQVVNEPVAACLAHGIEQYQDRRYVLVYRIGGSTMTATVLLVSGGCYSVVDSSEIMIGGGSVTDVLVAYLGKEFMNKFKEDIMCNRRGKVKLAVEAEKIKHVLSTLDTAHCYVESLYDGLDFSTNVTRARFDNELSKVVGELIGPISALLTRCNLTTADISNLVLAGGTTKVVKIQKQLKSMFPEAEMSLNISPDECVAIGAAVQASLITKDVTLSRPVKMLAVSRDVLAVSEIFDGGKTVLVFQETAIPLRKSVAVPVPAGAKEVSIKIVFAPDTELALLKLAVGEKSKLNLGVHVHRDGSSHFTLTDKHTDKSTDALLKQQ